MPARGGDQRAVTEPFEAVVARYGATVLRVCRAVVGPDQADDAWSETFLAALRAYPALPADADVGAWLVTIAHRKALDAVRAAARRPVPVDPLPEAPADRYRPGGWERDVWEALRELPPRQRRAVAYHHLAGLPFTEVAELIGGSVEAARKASSDGIHALRRAGLTPGGHP
jgi:RNA polymerase sigma factor (sigma-70 family)